MHLHSPTKLVPLFVVVATTPLWMPISAWPLDALALDPPTPNLCDDDNIISQPDTFELVARGQPRETAIAVVVATEDMQSSSTNSHESGDENEDSNVVGYAYYNWEIWECKDYTNANEAAFYVYRYGAGFDSSTMDIKDIASWQYYSQTSILTYKCGGSIGACAFVNRDDALLAARSVANIMPTYETPHAVLTTPVWDAHGTMTIRGSPIGLFSNMIFTGCLVGSSGCFQAHVLPI